MPTLPKIFKPVTKNTLMFLFGLSPTQTILTQIGVLVWIFNMSFGCSKEQSV